MGTVIIIQVGPDKRVSHLVLKVTEMALDQQDPAEVSACFVRDAYDIDVHPIISLSNISRTIAVEICLHLMA